MHRHPVAAVRLTLLGASLIAGPAVAAPGRGQAQVAPPGPEPHGEVVVTARRSPRPIASIAPVAIGSVTSMIGSDELKADRAVRLDIAADEILLSGDRAITRIPIAAVHSFAIEHTSKPLLRGVAGTIAMLAPNGAGQLYSAIRPGAEMLTIFYRDAEGGLHGAVLRLSSRQRDAVVAALAARDLHPADPTDRPAEDLDGVGPVAASGWRVAAAAAARPDVQVMLPDAAGTKIPAAFVAGVYEQMVARTAAAGRFGTVWRQGDRRVDPAAMTMRLRVTGFQGGSAAIRGAIPVVGMIAGKTLIAARLRLVDADGSVVTDSEVKGSKRMLGESLAATGSLATRVDDAIAKAPAFAAAPSAHVAGRSDERPAQLARR